MSNFLWKVKANKNFGKLTKGMEVEVLVKNRTGQPYITEITEAIKLKYGIDGLRGMPADTFDYHKQ
jgi:hypothetical protein